MNNGMMHVDVEFAVFLGTLMLEMFAYCGVHKSRGNGRPTSQPGHKARHNRAYI
jgi:hypothetical protein